MKIVEVKDKYRIETNSDIYADEVGRGIEKTPTGTYDDHYVEWLEKQIVNETNETLKQVNDAKTEKEENDANRN